MASPREKLTTCDPVWASLRAEAETMAEREPALAGFVHATILEHDRLENAPQYHMAKIAEAAQDLSPLMTRARPSRRRWRPIRKSAPRCGP